MPEHAERPQNTFVVRFWWEWPSEDSGRIVGWRGRIEHVQSGEGMAFRDMRQMLAFIERFIPSWPPPPGGEAT
ncbi:MAG: hypothetical protein ACP5OO_11440 [Chloroflexia bacterium]